MAFGLDVAAAAPVSEARSSVEAPTEVSEAAAFPWQPKRKVHLVAAEKQPEAKRVHLVAAAADRSRRDVAVVTPRR